MSIHIAAKQGEIADKILLPGDPLRAKFIAENFLEDAVCFNEVRNMFGYTGTYKGHRVSVMGTGMGMPSISIYARELIVDYGVKKLIRVGTAGSLNEDVHVRELVLAQAAATNSNIIRNDWPQYDFPQIASFDLLDKAYHIAKDLGMTTHVGNVLSSDVFYSNYGEKNIELGKWGVKAVEMEAAALYYDRWKFESLHASDNPILQQFHSESVVNSSSLTELIVQLDLPDSVKVAAQQLRELEKSVRNPLAHLIKPFDEEELHRTTGFSSQDFMKNLIDLASYTGIHYDQANFYFDQANAVMEKLLKEK